MKIVFYGVISQLKKYGVDYELCPVGAHYMHCKIEQKIRHIRESFAKFKIDNTRLSIIQWEILGARVSNSINPILVGGGGKITPHLPHRSKNEKIGVG